MVRIRFTEQLSSLVIRKKVIPAAAPFLVIVCMEGMFRGRHGRVVPQQIRSERLIGDLPDPSSRRRQHHHPQKPIFHLDRVESVQT